MSKAMIAVDKSGSYRVYVTVTTDLVQEAVSIHDTTPVASAAQSDIFDRLQYGYNGSELIRKK